MPASPVPASPMPASPITVADIMTREIVTVRADAAVREAIHLMLDKHISGVPVVDAHGRLAGILTEGDLLRRAELGTQTERPRWLAFLLGPGRSAADYVQAHARTVGEIMTADVVSVAPDTPLADVVWLMERKHVRRLPVVSAGVPVGIVSRADLIRALSQMLAKDAEPAPGDTAIRRAILAEIERQPWGRRDGVIVTVHDGLVHLDGVIFDERERKALRVVAENAPGVKEVRDHLVWVEPTSGMSIEPGEDGWAAPKS